MATLLSLDRRIKAAKNVSKATKAMQMIAASKLKKAQEATLSTRPYVEKLMELTHSVSGKATETISHPYLRNSMDTGKSLVIILSPDKGLCGGLIANLLREFLKNVAGQNNTYILVGKKAQATVVKLEKEVIAAFPFGTTLPTFDMVYPIMQLIDEYFLQGKVDSVKILAPHFVSVFTQTPKITTLLPITLPKEEGKQPTTTFSLFEPNPEELLPTLLKHYIEMSIYQQFLESFVSEQSSRMIAMQNATDNARDIIDDLKLEYNKTRQAKITSELLDISGGRVAQA